MMAPPVEQRPPLDAERLAALELLLGPIEAIKADWYRVYAEMGAVLRRGVARPYNGHGEDPRPDVTKEYEALVDELGLIGTRWKTWNFLAGVES